MSRITTCPHCSTRLRVAEQITDKTLVCPHCFADVDNAGAGNQIRAAGINTDVKRDVSMGSIVLAVLIGLCVVGIAIVYLAPKDGEKGIARAIYLALLFAALEVIVTIAIIRGLVRWGIFGVRRPSAERALGIAFLSLGTIVAVIFFSFSPAPSSLVDRSNL